jgi:nucleoside-diphosphate-sugar epimerase
MNIKNLKILITGSTGFIGSRVAYKLLEKGYTDLRCFARPGSITENLESLKNIFPKAQIQIFRGDLANKQDAQASVEDVDLIFNCVAGMRGPIASMFLNTVVTTNNLLQAVVTRKDIWRFVHVSSFAVYGVANLRRNTIINEKTPLEGNLQKRDDPYTYVKLQQEKMVWDYREKYGLPTVVVRPGVVYGPEGDEISRRVGLKLFGYFLNIGKNNILPISYVDNCAEAIIHAGTVRAIEGQVFNIHDSDLCTCNDFLNLYLRKVKKIRTFKIPYWIIFLLSWLVSNYSHYSKGQIPSVLNTYKAASTWKAFRFDNTKIIKELGWKQAVTTPQGFKKHFQYWKNVHLSRNH